MKKGVVKEVTSDNKETMSFLKKRKQISDNQGICLT